MGEPFLGEIKLLSFENSPRNYAHCNGQLLPINQNQALFALLGTGFGGNGQTTFALPDMRGRCAMHDGNGHNLYEKAGSEAVTLTISQLPMHLHQITADDANADTPVVTGSRFAGVNNLYRAPSALVPLHATSVSNVGGSQPHNNMSPFLTISFVIALVGIFPSQN
jgi:microcystin-dependent protein